MTPNIKIVACAWIEDEDGVWHTSCDRAFQFIDGGPIENGAMYCLYCGEQMIAKSYGEQAEGVRL